MVEGNEVSLDAPTVTVRRTNVCQLSDKTPGVSTTTEAIRKAGRKSEMGHQIAKSAYELKRDMEFDLLSNNAKATAADATAPVSAGILTWIATNESTVGAAPTGDGSDTRTSGADRAFTEGQLKTVLQKTWTSGGDPDCIIMNGFNKQVMSGFTGNATRFKSAEDRKLMASIDIYDGDFGEQQIIPDRFMGGSTAGDHVLILEKRMWAVAYLMPFRIDDLAKIGHSERKMLSVQYCLEARNEAASGIVADLTSS